jgi:hypothetical protein
MTDLSPRKFELNEHIWVTIDKSTYSGRVFGYEDGRNLIKARFHFSSPGSCNCWAYHVEMYGTDGEVIRKVIVREDQLEKITDLPKTSL